MAVRDGGAATDFLRALPAQVWPTLGPREVGLVIASSGPWGELIGWTPFIAPPRAAGDHAPYWFYNRGGSAQAVYFASDGRGQNFLRDWQVPLPGGRIGHFDAAMYDALTPNPWGLSAEAHLVEVEVNGGEGAPPNLHFVVTDARIVDGTDAYPLVAADALTAARAAWDRWVVATRPVTDQTIEDARAASGEPYGDETVQTEVGLLPTWLPESRVLRVTFYRRVRRTSTRTAMVSPRQTCRKGAPCMVRHPVRTTSTHSYGAEQALIVDLDDHGRIVDEVSFGPSPIVAAASPTGALAE
ncbi:MAG: hypothetical protein H6709_09310 [Kofleriaceae bacterium]|nr:hypothetical protein [Kofleriaceae bacterium]MCB9572269.1 hypothetical protein [Kofleriaceae bacterium]